MIKLYKKEQLEELKEKYPKEMLKEAEEIMVLLDDNYGANRDVDKDLGGYIVLLESKEDVAEIKANSIKGLLPEYRDIIKRMMVLITIHHFFYYPMIIQL